MRIEMMDPKAREAKLKNIERTKLNSLASD